MRRIFAWLLLIGFIILIMNIFWWQFAQEVSVVIYIIIVTLFFYSNLSKNRKSVDTQNEKNKNENTD